MTERLHAAVPPPSAALLFHPHFPFHFHSHSQMPETILIVDDTPANLSVLVDTLSEAGYQLMVAEDGEDALAQTAHTRPDLILLDVMMPGLDGFETCARLKASADTRDIPVIFL